MQMLGSTAQARCCSCVAGLPCPYGASQSWTAIATNLNGCCRGQCHLPANIPCCRLRNQARAGGTASMCWLPGTSPPCPAGWGSPTPLPRAPCHPAACSQQPRMSVCRGSPAERRTDGSTLGSKLCGPRVGWEQRSRRPLLYFCSTVSAACTTAALSKILPPSAWISKRSLLPLRACVSCSIGMRHVYWPCTSPLHPPPTPAHLYVHLEPGRQAAQQLDA